MRPRIGLLRRGEAVAEITLVSSDEAACASAARHIAFLALATAADAGEVIVPTPVADALPDEVGPGEMVAVALLADGRARVNWELLSGSPGARVAEALLFGSEADLEGPVLGPIALALAGSQLVTAADPDEACVAVTSLERLGCRCAVSWPLMARRLEASIDSLVGGFDA